MGEGGEEEGEEGGLGRDNETKPSLPNFNRSTEKFPVKNYPSYKKY